MPRGLATIGRRVMGMGRMQAGSVPTEVNAICPPITPTVEATLLTNGSMEAGNPPSSWSATGANLTGAADERTGGAGAQSINVANSAGAAGVAYQAVTLTVGEYYQLSSWAKKVTSNALVSLQQNGGAYTTYGNNTTSSLTWANLLVTIRAGAAGCKVNCANVSATAGQESRHDDVALQHQVFSSLRTYLVTRKAKNGTYICHPTVASGTQAGLLCEYLDDNNFVAVIVNRQNNALAAQIVSRIAGTWAIDRTGTVTYADGKELKLVVNEAVHQLFYDSAQVGADANINTAGMGYQVHGFSTLSTNTVGAVTTNP